MKPCSTPAQATAAEVMVAPTVAAPMVTIVPVAAKAPPPRAVEVTVMSNAAPIVKVGPQPAAE